jgi:glycosyltransferase involved in cell wall biosynthesis
MTADAVGGVWTYALDLAKGLTQAGVEVKLAVLGPSPAAHQSMAALAVPRLCLLDTGLPMDWTAEQPADLVEAGEALAELAREIDADLVHLNSPALAAEARFPVPVVGACHSCLGTWWAAVKGGRPPADFGWRIEATRRGYAACDALIAPTIAFAKATAALHHLPTPRVVANGRQPLGPRPAAVRAERLVFTSGRLWDQGKNLAALDAAADLIDAPVFAAGPVLGPNHDRIHLHNIEVLGPQTAESLDDWTARAAVYCSTALYEPFGLGVLEAAQAGCALVLSDIPTFRELWSDAAMFVDPKDPAAIAAALTRLLDDPELRRRLAYRAKTTADRYTAAAMTDGVLDVYRSALAADRGRRDTRTAAEALA